MRPGICKLKKTKKNVANRGGGGTHLPISPPPHPNVLLEDVDDLPPPPIEFF